MISSLLQRQDFYCRGYCIGVPNGKRLNRGVDRDEIIVSFT